MRVLWQTLQHGVKGTRCLAEPLSATAVTFAVIYHGPRLVHEPKIRNVLIVLFTLSFAAAAAAAGAFGAIHQQGCSDCGVGLSRLDRASQRQAAPHPEGPRYPSAALSIPTGNLGRSK